MDTQLSPPVGPAALLALTVHPADTSASARAWAAAAAVQLLAPALGVVLAALVGLAAIPATAGLLAAGVVAALGAWASRSLRAAAWRHLDDAVAATPSQRVRVVDLSQRPLSPAVERACTAVLLATGAVIAWGAL